MATQIKYRLQGVTSEQLLLLAIFGDDIVRQRVNVELDRRARLQSGATIGRIDGAAAPKAIGPSGGPPGFVPAGPLTVAV